ncbi:MAG: hypothetical protein LBU73_04210 [Helicobacteraceae bacterium]|nr:hypothetical protein [Helicobacteraceae bacterium]
MNKDFQEAIKICATGSRKELNGFLRDKSKDNLIAIFNDLLTTYINDKNSSTLREYIRVAICGYRRHESKLGYNGYRQTTIGGKTKYEFCEVKPKNISGKEPAKGKLNAAGNFTDYTWDRFDKDYENNPNMLVSGFVSGKLIYIFEFEFRTKSFVERLRKLLENKFPNRVRKSRDYLRSASFDYKNFTYDPNTKIHYLASKEELLNYKEFINKDFFKILTEAAK